MSRYPHLLLYLSATARKGLHEIRNKLAHSGFNPLLVRLSLVNPIPRIIAKLQSTINQTLSLISNKRTFFFDTSTMRLYSIYIIIYKNYDNAKGTPRGRRSKQRREGKLSYIT